MTYYHVIVESLLDSDTANPFVNSFTYLTSEVTPTSAGALGLLEAMKQLFFSPSSLLTQITHPRLWYGSMVATAPQLPSVLASTIANRNGTASGEMMPPFVAYPFKCLRSRGDVRSGFKRFGGMSEGAFTGTAYIPSTQTILEGLCSDLGDTLPAVVGGVGVTYAPIVVKRVKYVAPSGRDAYRLPTGLDPFVYAPADQWTYGLPTSQVSRKR